LSTIIYSTKFHFDHVYAHGLLFSY